MGGQHTATVGIDEEGCPRLRKGFAGNGGHEDNVDFRVIEMRQGKRALTMTWGGLIEIEKAWLFSVCGTFPQPGCGDFDGGKGFAFPIKGRFTNWWDLLFGAFLAVEAVD